MAGRRAPDQHHDRVSRRLLAELLGQPEFRMRGMLVGLQCLLNVEGYQVVTIDEATGTIELNRQFLAKQFELPSWLSAISVEDVVHAHQPLTGPRTRVVNVAGCISDRQQSSHVLALNYGDVSVSPMYLTTTVTLNHTPTGCI